MNIKKVDTNDRGGFDITVETTNADEFMKLYTLITAHTDVKPVVEKVAPKRHYKRKNVMTCTLCGKKFKGNIGLGLHKARAHEGKNWYKNGTPKVEPISNFIPVTQV